MPRTFLAKTFTTPRTAGIILCCVAIGCFGGPRVSIVPVAGHVTLGDKPVADAVILFENPNAGFAATAVIQADGSYHLRSQYGDGIPPGKYTVSVSPPAGRDEMDRPVTPSPAAAAIPERYHLTQTSGLTADVEAGKSSYDFKLDAS